MLRSLFIQNYVLIKELHIDFLQGFTVITGETGAGKSIILGAMSLILGDRADSKNLQDNSKKCIVEGAFSIEQYSLQSFFSANDLDYDSECILRREVLPSGKSRAFINDTPVTLHILRSLAAQLIDIHSQHQNLLLSKSDYQLNVVDIKAGTANELKECRNRYEEFRRLSKELEETIRRSENLKKDLDYWKFLSHEIEELDPKEDEEVELENERRMLSHAEEIKQALVKTGYLITESEENVLSVLKEILQSLDSIKPVYTDAQILYDRLNSVIIELDDISMEAISMEEGIETNSSKLEVLIGRIDSLFALLHKHRLEKARELVELNEHLQNKISEAGNMDENIEEIRGKLDEASKGLVSIAKVLSEKRKKSFFQIESEIKSRLQVLGMPNVQFKIECGLKEPVAPDGMDDIHFLFSASKGTQPERIDKTASGGEISRLMLSIKSMLSLSLALPTVIFDEIDMGVSGKIAAKMASIMKSLSENIQVICITHLPQIAGMGDHHFKVIKDELTDETKTTIARLENDDRITEIAHMLSGDKISDGALENARALLGNV